jgi:hypothetical protein
MSNPGEEMKMHREKYQDLMLRFAKEMHDVGVTENMKKVVADSYNRTPNVTSAGHEEAVRKFTYRHDGYLIEAVQTVKLTVKKCN